MPDERFVHPVQGHSRKVKQLLDLEFRVWVQYLLSADDFGVMRATPSKIKADNGHIDRRPVKTIQRCLDSLAKIGLVRAFEHQGERFLYSHNWQTYQKVEYPRHTNLPRPDGAALAECDLATRELFAKHPGGNGKKKRQEVSEDSPNIPQMISEGSPPTRASAPAKRLMANGERPMANGSEGSPRETEPPARVDEWARELVGLYPADGRCAAGLVEVPLFKALTEDSPGLTLWEAWAALLERLEQQQRSYRWRNKLMVPRLDRWLRDGAHLQVLPEHPPGAIVNDTTAAVLAAGDAFVKGGGR